MKTRLLVTSNSGGGKSHLLRLIAEQAVDLAQVIILDPEGEFNTLAGQFPFAVLSAGEELNHRQVGNIVEQLISTNASAVLDVSNWPIGIKRTWTGAFFSRLLQSVQPGSGTSTTPRLIIMDEVHLFCPQGEGSPATKALSAIMAMGRKRNICGILCSQRVSKVHKDCTAEVSNIIVGRTTLDTDQKRSGDMLGLDGTARKQLRDMQVGQFFAYGPAMTGSKNTGIQRFVSLMVQSPHEAGQKTITPNQAERQNAVEKLEETIRTMKVNYEDVEYGKNSSDEEIGAPAEEVVKRIAIWCCVPFTNHLSQWDGERAQDMIFMHNAIESVKSDPTHWQKYAREHPSWWTKEERQWYTNTWWNIVAGKDHAYK